MLLIFLLSSIVYDYNSRFGESCYRLIARTGQFIYLKTRGYLDIDPDTNHVRSFVCHNILISEDEGKKLIRDMKKKFAIMIQEDTEYGTLDCIGVDEPAVENPVQLEQAILSLITNLQTVDESGKTIESIASPTVESYFSDDQSEVQSDAGCSIKSTTSFAYIPPQYESIKKSIDKSITLVEAVETAVTPRRSTSRTPELPPPSISPPKKINVNETRPSVLQTTENYQKQSKGILHHSPEQPKLTDSKGRSFKRNSAITKATDPYTQPSQLRIKEEPYDASRVPPLPSSVGYFDSPPQPTIPASQSEHIHSYTDYMPKYDIYSPTSTTSTLPLNDDTKSPVFSGESSHFLEKCTNYVSSIAARSASVLKRNHSDAQQSIDSSTKQRRIHQPMYDGPCSMSDAGKFIN